MPLSPDEFLAGTLESSSSTAILQAAKTSKKDYIDVYKYINITSYSQREMLHECPRKFQIAKTVRSGDGAQSIRMPNIHFVFGHSVGAGIQAFLATGDIQAAQFAAFLAWNEDLFFENEKKKKSSAYAFLAVEKFALWWSRTFAKEWRIATLNGRPASEITFFIDMKNGYFHAGHIDVVLEHVTDHRYMVMEIKTANIKQPDEAMYGNSDQGLGYGVVLDAIAKDLEATRSYEVLYLIYSTSEREFTPFLDKKTRAMRADWLQDLLLDNATISTYNRISFFPKRGNACWSFSSRCPHFGTCDMQALTGKPGAENFKWWTPTPEQPAPEKIDYFFTIDDIKKGI